MTKIVSVMLHGIRENKKRGRLPSILLIIIKI